MKVIFINPPIEDFYITSLRRQPLGLLYLASLLKKKRHEVELINCHSPKKHKLALPKKFTYLSEFINHKNSNYRFPFNSYQRFGMSSKAIRETIKKTKGNIFLVSSLFTTYYEETEEIINYIQKFHKGIPIVVGGYHPSLFPEQFLQRTEVDSIIAGEGEYAVLRLINDFETGKPLKKIYLSECMINDLDKLPFPDRSMLKERDFNFYKIKSTAIISSRGCPNNCSFCTSRKFWKGNYAARSIDNVISEIDFCVKKYGISNYNFEDDNLFVHKARAIKFLKGIISFKKNTGVEIGFSAMNGISIEKIDDDIIKLMKMAGFNEINLSLVTGSVKLQERLNRPFNTFKFDLIAKMAKSLKMNVRAYYILGLPKQTKDEVVETIKYLNSIEVKSFPSVYYNITDKIEEWKVQRSSAFFNETNELTRQDLIELFNFNYLKNFKR